MGEERRNAKKQMYLLLVVDCEMIEEEAIEGGNMYFCIRFSSEPSLA